MVDAKDFIACARDIDGKFDIIDTGGNRFILKCSECGNEYPFLLVKGMTDIYEYVVRHSRD